jgi:predicted MFS family arabinose efflux permease
VLALLSGNFWLLNFGHLLVGAYQGFAQFYRFAAAEVASAEFKSRAILFVLAGGVIAAVAGPHLGSHTRDLLGSGATFAGSYATVVILSLAAMALLTRLHVPVSVLDAATGPARALPDIIRQPAFVVALTGAAVGYGVMILAMTATPLAMVAHNHAVAEAAFVIQWHVLGMFVPSFFTGTLIARFGVLPIMFTGALLLLGHVAIALSGVALLHFISALVLLGIGWNFLFVGGTTLLIEAYRPSEKAKVQALNDFLIFGVVVTASFASGGLLQGFGWAGANVAALPFVLAAATLIAGFAMRRRLQPSAASPG